MQKYLIKMSKENYDALQSVLSEFSMGNHTECLDEWDEMNKELDNYTIIEE